MKIHYCHKHVVAFVKNGSCPYCANILPPTVKLSAPEAFDAAPVSRLETALRHLIGRAQYVCAHKYGSNDPVGTRQTAVDDLRSEIARAIEATQSANDSSSATAS